ncbi:hypothetical protein OWV82_008697 [Melia azedarach]|uniref:Uncharacterized protein n=1 Tax=Melia azedarach TaxID=155640 RepID=A0ACC1YEA1_MELAZ|nr:hypothetical protein OWV82_008697 [Melia azedarach]
MRSDRQLHRQLADISTPSLVYQRQGGLILSLVLIIQKKVSNKAGKQLHSLYVCWMNLVKVLLWKMASVCLMGP